tara:strand:- start:90 stop:446 length:357 start_codon:yes stop_codon:yes gene_type:complete
MTTKIKELYTVIHSVKKTYKAYMFVHYNEKHEVFCCYLKQFAKAKNLSKLLTQIKHWCRNNNKRNLRIKKSFNMNKIKMEHYHRHDMIVKPFDENLTFSIAYKIFANPVSKRLQYTKI